MYNNDNDMLMVIDGDDFIISSDTNQPLTIVYQNTR